MLKMPLRVTRLEFLTYDAWEAVLKGFHVNSEVEKLVLAQTSPLLPHSLPVKSKAKCNIVHV